MLRNLFVLMLLAAAATANAQTATPDSENGRYTFNQVKEGILRLDTRTGQVSLCSSRPAGWACETVPDERVALEAEIARLQSENATLKREMIAHAVPLPGGLRADPGSRPQVELRLPSEADVDRLMTFMERIWRRLIDMVQNVQKDIDKKG
jgi:hypothetical protein